MSFEKNASCVKRAVNVHKQAGGNGGFAGKANLPLNLPVIQQRIIENILINPKVT
jgi:hypothetical protein